MDREGMATLMRRLSALERRLSALYRTGEVAEVQLRPYRVRVDIGPDEEGEPVLTDFLPVFVQRSGRVRIWTPLSVGERVEVISPGGEDASAFVRAGLFSMDFEAPSDDAATELVRFDADDGTEVARIEVTRGDSPAASSMFLRCGRSSLRLGGDGRAAIGADRLDYEDP